MRLLKSTGLVLAAVLMLGTLARSIRAEDKAAEQKIIGTVVKLEMDSSNAKTATATLKSKGKLVPIVVQDELTLNKFRIKKIQPGDEIRCIYKVIDGQNISTTFKRTAGC